MWQKRAGKDCVGVVLGLRTDFHTQRGKCGRSSTSPVLRIWLWDIMGFQGDQGFQICCEHFLAPSGNHSNCRSELETRAWTFVLSSWMIIVCLLLMDRQICWPMTSCAQGMDCQWWCLYASRFFKALQPGQGELQVTSSNPQWSKEIQLRNFGLRTNGISHPFSHHINQYYINCNHRHSTSSKNSTTKVNKGFLQEFWSEHHARVKCGLFVVVWGWGCKEKLSATWFRSGLGFGPAGFWSKQHYNFCWSEHRWCCGRRKAFIPFHFVLMSFDFHLHVQ